MEKKNTREKTTRVRIRAGLKTIFGKVIKTVYLTMANS
jgi:hypothetical protein